ncbi:hypothetical protein GP486_004647 [Trichoglossum hirsutum]|uniref:Uncharacterized protein n=1 Tax=Trichoglossum hirsutum TaxID=265104 RepID=A0A9P8LB03_9PEZI|nr:hypothetical protein GP486_004647 [Trichoglossum hirsutum]
MDDDDDAHSKPPTTPSRRRGRSLSFSLFGSLIPRRRSTQSEPLEPIEVAPGVMSTDAMAIVFELDPRRTKSVSPRKQKGRAEKGEVKRKSASRIPVWGANRAAHRDDGTTGDLGKHPTGVAATSYFEKRDRSRDEANMSHPRAEQQTTRGRRTRMRDSADYLTVRFANPNTGLVSPSLVSDGATATPPNEANKGVVEDEGLPSQAVVEEQRNEKQIEDLTRQQGDVIRRASSRWNAAQTPKLSPVAQSSRTTTSPARRGVSNPTVAPGDRFILRMPSAQEPCPFEHPGKTSEQILAYQRGVEAARRQASGGLVDPSTPPSPRPNSPAEECGTSPRLDRSPTMMIRRKPVGSAVSKRSESEDTVIINGARRSASLPAAPHGSSTHPAIKVTTPERITRNLSSISNQNPSHRHSQSQQPFLGDRADGMSTQANDTAFRLSQDQRVENQNLLHHLQSRQDIDQPRLHRPLSFLPEVNITHPDLASIPTSQRPRGNRDVTLWNLQDASTTITPTTTTTIGPYLQTEALRDCDGYLLPSVSRGVYQLRRGTTPERCGLQTHRGGSWLADRTRNTEGPVQHASSPHPPCLVSGQQAQQVLYLSTRTSTSTYPQTSPDWTAESPQQQQHPTHQGGRPRRNGFPGNSARDAAVIKASATNGALYGMDIDGGREARNDDNMGDTVVVVKTRNSSSNSNSNGDGMVPWTVPSEDRLTEWRSVERWRRPLTDDEEVEEAREREKERERAMSNNDHDDDKPLRGVEMREEEDEASGYHHRHRSSNPISTTPAAAGGGGGMALVHTLLTSLLAMLAHIRSVCTPWSPTNRLLTSPDATMRDYLAVAAAWALAGIYVVVLACAASVGVGVVSAVKRVLGFLGFGVFWLERRGAGR